MGEGWNCVSMKCGVCDDCRRERGVRITHIPNPKFDPAFLEAMLRYKKERTVEKTNPAPGFYVWYRVRGKDVVYTDGPYPDRDTVKYHYDDISSFYGIWDCRIIERRDCPICTHPYTIETLWPPTPENAPCGPCLVNIVKP